jgi:hypothetical protein
MDERLVTPEDRFAALKVSTAVEGGDGASPPATIRGK